MIANLRSRAAVAAVLLALACGEKKEAPPAPPPTPIAVPREPPVQPPPAPPTTPPQTPTAAPMPTPPPVTSPIPPPTARTDTPPSPHATAGGESRREEGGASPTPTSPPTSTPPPTSTAPPAERAAPPPASPAAPAAGAHAKVGPDKCKMCHRLQYDSWAASPHAAKGLDCEGCHGNGADYRSAAIMRDRAKAVAAGLVLPALTACRRCHGAKADAALFAKVHAHKPG